MIEPNANLHVMSQILSIMRRRRQHEDESVGDVDGKVPTRQAAFSREEHSGLISFSEVAVVFLPCPSIPIRVLVRAPALPTWQRHRRVFPQTTTELCRHLRLRLAVASQSILRMLGRSSHSMVSISTAYTRILNIMGVTQATHSHRETFHLLSERRAIKVRAGNVVDQGIRNDKGGNGSILYHGAHEKI